MSQSELSKLDESYIIDILKGLLILWVLVDHNDYIRSIVPNFIRLLNFHVIGFLVIPFLFNNKSISFDRVKVYFARYYLPFIYFFVFAALSNYFLKSHYTFNVHELSIALLTGSMTNIDKSINLSMLWFLPTLFSTVCLVLLYNRITRSLPLFFFILVMLLGHICIGGGGFSQNIPFGLGVSLYVFILGFLVKKIIVFFKYYNVYLMFFCAFIIYLVTLNYGIENGLKTEVGACDVPTFRDFIDLIVIDALGLSGFLSMYYVARLIKSGFLKYLGKNSLKIYMVHPYFYFVFLKFVGYTGSAYIAMMASLVFSIIGAYFFIEILRKNYWLDYFLFPKDFTSYFFINKN